MKLRHWTGETGNRKGKKHWGLVAVIAVGLLTAALGFAGCGSTPAAQEGTAKTIVIGTGHAYEPYCYLDADGNLTGYELEVLKTVNELLPQYKFEFQTFDFANVLLSLDAGKIDIGAHQYELNEERQKKYLFGRESYTTYTTHVTVPVGNTTIHSLEDLQGKKVMTPVGSNKAYLLEKYNAEHPDTPITIAYVSNNTDEEIVAGLQNGTWDATLLTKRDAAKLNKAFGNGQEILKQVGTPFSTSKTYFVFGKNETELQQEIDGALKQLKESGRLAEISRQVLGDDYTESE